MKILLSIHLTLGFVLSAAVTLRAQEPNHETVEQPQPQVIKVAGVDTETSVSPDASQRRAELNRALQTMRDAFRRYREVVGEAIKPEEELIFARAIQKVEKELHDLELTNRLTPLSAMIVLPQPQQSCDATPTDFCLGRAPADKATDVPVDLTMGWTKPTKPVREYLLQVSADESFSTLTINEHVTPDPNAASEEYKVKRKDGIVAGEKYFWRVLAIFTDETSAFARNGVHSFTTTQDFFSALASRGFKLQKALTGPDKGELAEFGFLNTIGKKTVYSANFALSWQPKTATNIGFTNIRPSLSVEGNLASDDSESEDAWRFRGGAIFLTSLVRCKNGGKNCGIGQQTSPTIRDWYNKLSVKLEGDKNFDVKKLSAEFLTTVNSFDLAIGAARPGNPSKPVQFQWRPFFGLDAGHTFRSGVSEEKKDTILRLVPRIRTRIDLQFLRRALNMNEVAIFADDTFWYLPLEKGRKRNNFLTTGIEFTFTPNLGFGLTYKSGRSAPNFQKINTLQGIIGIRFGK